MGGGGLQFNTVGFDIGLAGLSKSDDVCAVIADDPLRLEGPASSAGHGHDH